MHELCDVYACITYFPMYCIGPPSPFTGTPSEETVLDVYRGASIHRFTEADYDFAKAVSCLRLISVFKVHRV